MNPTVRQALGKCVKLAVILYAAIILLSLALLPFYVLLGALGGHPA